MKHDQTAWMPVECKMLSENQRLIRAHIVSKSKNESEIGRYEKHYHKEAVIGDLRKRG